MSNSLQLAGLLTHLLVLALGIGGIVGIVPLARGRRAGFGLVLITVSMGIVILAPHWNLGVAGATAYVVGFLAGLWLLLGPEHRR